MKPIIIILITICALSLRGQQMYRLNPATGFAAVNDISMRSAYNGIAVGNSGKILHYNGHNWSHMESPVTVNLMGVHYLTSNNAWAVGDSGTIIHFNGSYWTEQQSNTEALLRDVHFVHETMGWAVGNTLLRFDGNSWIEEMDVNGLNAVHFYDEAEGWAVGEGKQVYKYTEGEWQVYNAWESRPYFFTDVVMTGPQSGWKSAFGWDFPFSPFHEYNGVGWSPAGVNAIDCYGLAFANHDNGWGLNNVTPPLDTEPRIMKIEQGNWTTSRKFTASIYLLGIDAPDINNAFASTNFGYIYHYKNGKWSISNGFADADIHSIDFKEAEFGRITSGRSGIMRYEYGSWSNELEVPDYAFNGVYFPTGSVGWATANRDFNFYSPRPRVYKYTGGSWSLDYELSQYQYIYSLFALDSTLAWVGSYGGNLYSLTGTNWEHSQIAGADKISDIYFENPQKGWIATNRPNENTGLIMHFDNGGWVTQLESELGPVNDLCFLDDGTAYAAGDGGGLYFFNGEFWSVMNSPSTANLNTISIDANHQGYAAGMSGILLTCNDGVWELHEQNLGTHMYAISLPEPGVGFFGGRNGVFFATIDSLPVSVEQQRKPKKPVSLTIMPNPARDQLKINIHEHSFTGETYLICYNMLGVTVHFVHLSTDRQQVVTDVSHWPAGMYVAVLYSDGRPVGKGKFVVH